MSYEQAQANLEIAFDWLNAMRHRDIDAIGELFHPDLVWVDVAGAVACDGREQALAWLRTTPNELNEVDASSGAAGATGSRLSFPLGAGNESSFRSSGRQVMGVVTITDMSCLSRSG